MLCAPCHSDTNKILACVCGQCKECHKQIPYQSYTYCLDCSKQFKNCYKCGISIDVKHMTDYIERLNELKGEEIHENNMLLELAKKYNLNYNDDNIDEKYNNYINKLNQGQINFY
jgi:hypothetical protein